MKPGWKSSEFWITVVGQILALLALTGVIHMGDKEKLESALTNAVAAVFTLIASTVIVVRYIRSRTELKSMGPEQGERPSSKVLPVFLLVIAGAFVGNSPLAAAPSVRTCFLFGRQQRSDPAVLAALQQLAQNQQMIISLLQQRSPAPSSPIIVVPPPYQNPYGNPPRQQIPLGGTPRQQIPLGGPPRQQIPIGEAPRQQIPLGPAPRQQIPIGPPPPQQIPLGPPSQPMAPPQGVEPQTPSPNNQPARIHWRRYRPLR